METKRAYLLTEAQHFQMDDISSAYDPVQHLNVVSRNGHSAPLATDDDFGRTESKTMQAPGDDDPDPEDEGCY